MSAIASTGQWEPLAAPWLQWMKNHLYVNPVLGRNRRKSENGLTNAPGRRIVAL
jgi:hypothetical protein